MTMLKCLLIVASLLPAISWAGCDSRLAVQILGSGGPIPDDDRASSGYLIWEDKKARALIDAGGGVFLRFGEAGADIADLDIIVLTHLHTDHSADLAALFKGGFFTERSRELPVVGPTGRGVWPSMKNFMRALFDKDSGAYAYLAGVLDGSGGLFKTPVREVDAQGRDPEVVFEDDGMRIMAVGVNHGPLPALGLLVEAGGKRIAITGDQNGNNPHYVNMIRGVDLLIVDHAIPSHAGQEARDYHLTPEQIGDMAADAGAGRLVLSHLMPRSLAKLDESQATIRTRYTGPVEVASDLMCLELGQ